MLQWDPHFVAEFLKAVAQETRLRIVRLLYLHAGEELSAGIIAVDLDVPPNLLSFHLKELVSVGVVCKTSSGRNVFYAITPKTRKFIHVFREEFGVRRKNKDSSEKSESDKWNAITDEVTH